MLNFEEFVSLASRLRAMQSGDEKKAKELYSAWLKKCSQQLQQSKRAKQAAVAAAKKEFQKGSSIEKALETATNAAAAANGTMKDISAASSHVEQKLQLWVNEELYTYADQGKVEEVEACMRKGGSANWENPDKDGFTPLMAACEMNRDDVVEILAKWYSTNVNILCSPAQTTATHLAAKHRDCKCLKVLVKEGADLYSKCRPNDTPVLSIASQFGNIAGVKLLLQARAPINACDMNGWSPLMSTIDKKQFECATFIIAQCDPDMNTLSKDGKSALDLVNAAIAMCTDSVPIVLQDLQEFKIVLTRNGGRTGRDLRSAARAQAMAEREAADFQSEFEQTQQYSPPAANRPLSSKRGMLLSDGGSGGGQAPTLLPPSAPASSLGGISLDDELNSTGLSFGGEYGSGREVRDEHDYAKTAYGGAPSMSLSIRSGLRSSRRSVASIPKIDKIVRQNSRNKAPSANLMKHITRGLPSSEGGKRKPRQRKLYASTSFHI